MQGLDDPFDFKYVKGEPGQLKLNNQLFDRTLRIDPPMSMTHQGSHQQPPQGFASFPGMGNDNMMGSYNAGLGPNGFTAAPYTAGSAMLGDEDLLESFSSPLADQSGRHHQQHHSQDFNSDLGGLNLPFSPGLYGAPSPTVPVTLAQFGNLSPHVATTAPHGQFMNYAASSQSRIPQHIGNFAESLHSPISFSGSPMGADLDARFSQSLQTKPSTGHPAHGTKPSHSVAGGTSDVPIFATHKPAAPQWMQHPASMVPFASGGFSPGHHDVPNSIPMIMGAVGTSMPAKLNAATSSAITQELKKKKRRESHNLVERRRRDNINERIQDLSKLVPSHRLEDEKVRKLISSGAPLSPLITGPPSGTAQSASMGGFSRRTASVGSGTINTGLPIEEKDKGPNKGDILYTSVAWTRDLLWFVKRMMDQQDELANYIAESGGDFPIQYTEDDRRMRSELTDLLDKCPDVNQGYSRFAGSGLRVPHHTDYRGEPLSSNGGEANNPSNTTAIADSDSDGSQDMHMVGNGGFESLRGQFWSPHRGSQASARMTLNEEDEFGIGMDLS